MHHPSQSLERTITVSFAHRIFFTRAVFSPANALLTEILSANEGRAKVLVVIDQGVVRAFPKLAQEIISYFGRESRAAQLVSPPLIVSGGEAVKNNRDLVDQLYREIERHGIDRHSYVLAIGGGALLDAAGFAAATAHRGVRLIRLPTTSLSQADGGVGVKNGVNAFGKKNFIGAFATPFAVINDADFLEPLPAAEKRAGLIEAIKVALIRDAAFFAEIEKSADALARLESAALERIIHRCAELHVEHIATSGDPFELGSARPLDFGHWSAHKLEQLSGFAIPHGAAVAHGIALDVIYSAKSSMLSASAAERILALIEKLGFALFDPLMTQDGGALLLAGLEEFREHLGGELTITLLRDIGRGEEVHAIDAALMRESLRELERRAR
ncbi:MAG TPA: 3-dehydroquinate synthase [Candidatus Methylacidiphilales bacterium]|jgi:3-dehydroquinate synthase|nr:3-dehydroquinate synthase [Candidatus Methylacidiphilales bacterium]